MSSYLPNRQAELLIWAQDFSALVTDDPENFGLTALQAEPVTTAVAAFAAAYETSANRETRTPVNVEAKNAAKKIMIAAVRQAVKIIQAWPSITDTKRSQLGITVPDTNPTPIPIPETSPRLEVVVVLGRQIKLKLRPSEGDGRARPAGVSGAYVYYTVGESYSEDIETWQFKGGQSKTTVTVNIPDTVPGGAKVWLTAQWFNRKAQTGPACPPVETRIAGGLSQAA